MGLETRIAALEQARQPTNPDMVILAYCRGNDGMDRVTVRDRAWISRKGESTDDFHDRVARELRSPPGTSHIFIDQLLMAV